jgi:hypothetical protein
MENTRKIAKAKRICQETAGKIHDIVEESLWTDYIYLQELSLKLIEKIKEYENLKKNGS